MSFKQLVESENKIKKVDFKKFAKEEYERLSKNTFEGISRGSIILTNKHKSFFAGLIRMKGRRDSGECFVNHGERYLCYGLSISADLKVNIHPIKKFFNGKYDI